MEEDDNNSKRTRARQACEPCRKKKTKCSGEYPICSNCSTHKYECRYVTVEKRRGPQKGYVRALENRLDSLQNLLEDYVEKISPSIPDGSNNEGPFENFLDGGEVFFQEDNIEEIEEEYDVESPILNGGDLIATSNTLTAKEYESNQNGTDLPLVKKPKYNKLREQSSYPRPTQSYIEGPNGVSRSHPPPMLAHSQPKKVGHITLIENGVGKYLGESAGAYFLNHGGDEDNTRFKVPEMGLEKFSSTNSNPNFTLTKQQLDFFIATYFTTFHTLFPIIVQDDFLKEYNSPNCSLPTYLLDAMCAITNKYHISAGIPSPIVNAPLLGEACFFRARQHVLTLLDTSTNYLVITHLLLSLCHHISTPNMGWMNSGIAIRQALELGLHRDYEVIDENEEDIHEREARRRIWWACYVIDRLSCVSTGRPLTIDEDEYDTPFPDLSFDTGAGLPDTTHLSLPTPPNNTLRHRYFSKFMELCQIYGKVSRNIYSVRSRHGYTALKLQSHIHHLDDTLQGWYHALLREWPELNDNDSSPQNTCYWFGLSLKLFYHTLVILLHRPLLPKTTKPLTSFARSYFEKAELSARSILDIISNDVDAYRGIPFCHKFYPITISFSIHLVGASSTIPEETAREKAKQYILDVMCIISKLCDVYPLCQKFLLGCISTLTTIGILPLGYLDENWPDPLKQTVRLYTSAINKNGSFFTNVGSETTGPIKATTTTTKVPPPTHSQQTQANEITNRRLNPTQFLQAQVIGSLQGKSADNESKESPAINEKLSSEATAPTITAAATSANIFINQSFNNMAYPVSKESSETKPSSPSSHSNAIFATNTTLPTLANSSNSNVSPYTQPPLDVNIPINVSSTSAAQNSLLNSSNNYFNPNFQQGQVQNFMFSTQQSNPNLLLNNNANYMLNMGAGNLNPGYMQTGMNPMMFSNSSPAQQQMLLNYLQQQRQASTTPTNVNFPNMAMNQPNNNGISNMNFSLNAASMYYNHLNNSNGTNSNVNPTTSTVNNNMSNSMLPPRTNNSNTNNSSTNNLNLNLGANGVQQDPFGWDPLYNLNFNTFNSSSSKP